MLDQQLGALDARAARGDEVECRVAFFVDCVNLDTLLLQQHSQDLLVTRQCGAVEWGGAVGSIHIRPMRQQESRDACVVALSCDCCEWCNA